MDEIWFDSVIIFNGTFTEEKYKNLSRKLQRKILTLGGNKVSGELMGKRKLAYEIKGTKVGYYTVYQFCVPEDLKDKVIQKLERFYRIDDTILKFMNIRLDAPEIFDSDSHMKILTEMSAGEQDSNYTDVLEINALDVLLGLAHYDNSNNSK